MSSELTASQFNKLGERLRKGKALPADHEMLALFIRSFVGAKDRVIRTLSSLRLRPAEREKTAFSIVQKLQRESIRLSRLQDIAGCRVIVENVAQQDEVTSKIVAAFPNAKTVDRRQRPMHGYRAVHVIVEIENRFVEIQVRTELQHLWAQWSESLATTVGQEIKYGGGPESLKRRLEVESATIAQLEERHGQVNIALAASLRGLSQSAQTEISRSIESAHAVAELVTEELTVIKKLEHEIMTNRRRSPKL